MRFRSNSANLISNPSIANPGFRGQTPTRLVTDRNPFEISEIVPLTTPGPPKLLYRAFPQLALLLGHSRKRLQPPSAWSLLLGEEGKVPMRGTINLPRTNPTSRGGVARELATRVRGTRLLLKALLLLRRFLPCQFVESWQQIPAACQCDRVPAWFNKRGGPRSRCLSEVPTVAENVRQYRRTVYCEIQSVMKSHQSRA